MNLNPILYPYIDLAKMIVETFGDDCEVVLHDLSDIEHSVVYVENPKVTGRVVGESFDQLIKKVILSKELKNNHVSNYYFKSKNNKLIRSSTLLIRDNDNNLNAALCINIDTSKITDQINSLIALLPNSKDMFLKNLEEESIDYNIELDDDSLTVKQMIITLIDNILKDSINPKDLSRDQKIEKIRFMDNKGIFLMKGSVDIVADKLGVNKVTIYSYLDIVRGKRE